MSANPYELRADLSRLLKQIHTGEIGLGIATERCARLVEAGLDGSVIANDIDSHIRMRQAARQKDLMALHSFVQGVEWARKQRGGE